MFSVLHAISTVDVEYKNAIKMVSTSEIIAMYFMSFNIKSVQNEPLVEQLIETSITSDSSSPEKDRFFDKMVFS